MAEENKKQAEKKATSEAQAPEHAPEEKGEGNASGDEQKEENAAGTGVSGSQSQQGTNEASNTTQVAHSDDLPDQGGQDKNEPFDWDSYSDKVDDYSEEERKELDKLYEQALTSIGEKEVIKGKVVSKTRKEVVVNIGYKSEGVIPASEFRYHPDLQEGDEVDVFVEQQEDSTGQLVLSHQKARTHKAWEKVNQAMENDEVIPGKVKCRTKGGLIVDVFGIEAFLPGSQVDVRPIRDYDAYVGQEMNFKVVKINKEFKNVVVSHKALIEAELEEQKKKIIQGLEKGQVLEGTVKNITSYGVFVDLGGVDGLIHITDLSWGRINHPEEVVELDQKINVVILDFDDEKKRIALGLKQLQEHPWDGLDPDLKVGDKVKGKVVVLADYGAFVEIQPGVEGLIHVSEMSWSQHLRSAQDFLKVGDEVEAQILTLDREERKMSLGLKQLTPDPWENIEEKYPVDSKHTGMVRNFTNFGVFVELEEGVDGLVHISDLSWSKRIKHPSEFCKVGDELQVVVLEVDKEERKLSLGHKQLEENPWDVFESVFTVGSVHKGTITSIEGKTATVMLPYGVEGYAPLKHLKKEDGETAKVEEELDFKVLEFNKRGRKIIVSHSRIHEEAEEEEKKEKKKKEKAKEKSQRKAVNKVNKNIERTTLGDLNTLSDLKSSMEEEEGEKKGTTGSKKEEDEEQEGEEGSDPDEENDPGEK